MLTPAAWLTLVLAPLCSAQFPSWLNSANLTTVTSPVDPSISIAYKVPHGACTTVFDTQEQFTGWVSVPGADYPTNLFFWFVGARDPTAMLTVYLNGGPGSSSLFGMFAEAGPCEVVELSAERLGTVAREWGWDRASNMLFVDQPNQVGFSFDTPTNGTLDLGDDSNTIHVPPVASLSAADSPLLVRNGTFASQDANRTAHTTTQAARAVYHLMQGFLATFPRYNPPANSSLGVNLFAESYGGHYGPIFAAQWQAENTARRGSNSTNASNSSSAAASRNTTVDIHLAALGIINGCVDDLVQSPYYASMMVNNSYGFRAMSPLQASLVNASFYTAGGCRELIVACRAAVAANDSADAGTNAAVNQACSDARLRCASQLLDPYANAGRSYYDIAHTSQPDSFPPSYYLEYLNTAAVQSAIGTPLNFTLSSSVVYKAFAATGDLERAGCPYSLSSFSSSSSSPANSSDYSIVDSMAALLQAGVRIGLVYGDRDFICNWLGGEALSLALAQAAGGEYAARFPLAGYAPIIVNDSYIGGVVRQFGNLSFSRIYQAGHFVPAYQPESAFQVFARIILGTDIGTGESVDLRSFNSSGPANATRSLSLPANPPATCFLRNLPTACATDQQSSLRAGQGVVINGVWYAASSQWPGPATSLPSAPPTSGTTPTGTISPTAVNESGAISTLTGVYTATATPGAAGSSLYGSTPSTQSLAALVVAVLLFTSTGAEIVCLRL